jgi:hypothetical protein
VEEVGCEDRDCGYSANCHQVYLSLSPSVFLSVYSSSLLRGGCGVRGQGLRLQRQLPSGLPLLFFLSVCSSFSKTWRSLCAKTGYPGTETEPNALRSSLSLFFFSLSVTLSLL